MKSKKDKKSRKYVTYNSVLKSLGRDKVPSHGAVAKLLLDTFIVGRGELKAAQVEELGLCGDGTPFPTFSKWRDALESLGWLSYDETLAKHTRRWSEHQPGRKLIKYLNKERTSLVEMATKPYVDEQIQALKAELTEFRLACIEISDPPVDQHKIEKYTKDPTGLITLLRGLTNA